MPKRLILLRHAKSAWDTDAPDDHSRPLARRGQKDAPRIGARLAGLDWVPEAVISSDSARTRETWACMEADLLGDAEVDLRFTRDLYHADEREIRAAIRDLPDSVRTAMVIGHNPGWEEAVYDLSNVHATMSTCNAALLTLDTESWEEASRSQDWELVDLLRPKEL